MATRYFSVTTAAIRMYDTNHLILGVKAEGQEIEPNLIKAAAPYVNVFSLEDYVLPPGTDQASTAIWPAVPSSASRTWPIMEAVANIPLMIGEYSFASYVNSSGDPDTVPGSTRRPRPSSNAPTSSRTSSRPCTRTRRLWSVTTGSSTSTNRPNGRTGDAENFDFGMIDVNGNPYPTMVSAMQLMHNVVADQAGDNGPVCDSWAAGSSGVTCTATMPSSTDVASDHRDQLSAARLKSATTHTTSGRLCGRGTPGYTYALTQGSLPRV